LLPPHPILAEKVSGVDEAVCAAFPMRQKSERLSHKLLRGTASILQPQYLTLSPLIGAICSSACPNLSSNLRKFPLIDSSALEFFHQRQDQFGRPFGPLSPTKSKSKAAYWLSPSSLGNFVGMSIPSPEPLTKLDIDNKLKLLGIDCNYVNGLWTGVSLDRYRRLVRTFEQNLLHHDDILHQYAIPIALHYLWETVTTKKCLLDYLLGIEQASGLEILHESYADLRIEGSSLREAWLRAKFDTTTHISKRKLQDASTLLTNDFNYSNIADNDKLFIDNFTLLCPLETQQRMSLGYAMEIVATSILQERSKKTPIKLGRYSHRGGKHKPDCVEVVVREVFDSLFYGTCRLDV
jgi:hypothetical protein